MRSWIYISVDDVCLAVSFAVGIGHRLGYRVAGPSVANQLGRRIRRCTVGNFDIVILYLWGVVVYPLITRQRV